MLFRHEKKQKKRRRRGRSNSDSSFEFWCSFLCLRHRVLSLLCCFLSNKTPNGKFAKRRDILEKRNEFTHLFFFRNRFWFEAHSVCFFSFLFVFVFCLVKRANTRKEEEKQTKAGSFGKSKNLFCCKTYCLFQVPFVCAQETKRAPLFCLGDWGATHSLFWVCVCPPFLLSQSLGEAFLFFLLILLFGIRKGDVKQRLLC